MDTALGIVCRGTTTADSGTTTGTLGTITSGALTKQLDHLEQLGLLEFFPMRVYSYEFDFRKPDVRILRIAAERIGHEPEHIAYIGDRIDKDIIPALRLGMQPVLKAAYTNAGKKIPAGTCKITHLSELPALIEKINNHKIIVTENV
jgi:putative hydrolase of the HAD superfamily